MKKFIFATIFSVIIITNSSAYDVTYENSSYMYNYGTKKCEKISKEKFNEVFASLKKGTLPFLGGVQMEMGSNGKFNKEYVQFFLLPISKTEALYGNLSTTIDSCNWAVEEIMSGRIKSRFK